MLCTEKFYTGFKYIFLYYFKSPCLKMKIRWLYINASYKSNLRILVIIKKCCMGKSQKKGISEIAGRTNGFV